MQVLDEQTEQIMLPRNANPHPARSLFCRFGALLPFGKSGLREGRRQVKEGHRFIGTAHSSRGKNRIQGMLPKRMAQ